MSSDYLTVDEIVAEARRQPRPNLGYQIGTDMEGHKRRYRIVGYWPDGTARTESWSAQHMDDCKCSNPEEWY